jgi:hypothetical protein
MARDDDDHIRIVYDEERTGEVQPRKNEAPSRREAMQALLSAQLQGVGSGLVSGTRVPFPLAYAPSEDTRGAALRAPLPPPTSPRCALHFDEEITSSGCYDPANSSQAAEQMPSTPLPVPLPKPTMAELKAEIASLSKAQRSVATYVPPSPSSVVQYLRYCAILHSRSDECATGHDHFNWCCHRNAVTI